MATEILSVLLTKVKFYSNLSGKNFKKINNKKKQIDMYAGFCHIQVNRCMPEVS